MTKSLILLFPISAMAKLHFDPSMIDGNADSVSDLSQFEREGTQLAGAYPVDIYLNGNNVASRIIGFMPAQNSAEAHDVTGLVACLSKKDLLAMGVNISAFAALNSRADDYCVSLGKDIPGAYSAFDFSNMRLDISMPQAAMQTQPHDWIAPERWDEGINAALLSYQFSGSENSGRYGNSSSHYLNLNSGINFGPWRLRDNSSWSDYESRNGYHSGWQHLNTSVQRTIIPLRSELTMGDSSTSNEVFDAVSFRGVELATDDNMYPDTQRGYAPEIRGIARSNAQVSILQQGNVIYRTFVAPGAFVINDLFPLSTGGDLELEVKEADGSVRVSAIPYASIPLLQRQGHLRYALTAGEYRRSGSNYATPSFVQGTLLWGLPHNITAYGGAQLAEEYQAIALGAGINLGVLGAISADVTQANSTLPDGARQNGQSLRFLYGRTLASTGTTLQLAGYRYSTQGFHTLEETALKPNSGGYDNLNSNKRERLQVNITQQIGDSGSLTLSGSHQTYWHNAAAADTLQAGFNSHWGSVSYSLAYSYSQQDGQPHPDKAVLFSLSVPLTFGSAHDSSKQHQVWATSTTSRDGDGNLSQQTGLSGTALEENNLNWSVTQGYGQREGTNGDASLDYKGTYGNVAAGYGASNGYRQLRYGASGGIVATGSGVTLGQPLGTTNVLVAAPGAAGVPVENETGIHTDWRGYTVVPYASVYRENRVTLDVSHLNDNVDIDDAVTRVIPTRGALVRADFSAHTGVRALVTLIFNGKPVPFGAIVSAGDAASSGLVGDEGQVYLSGLSAKGIISAKWGNEANQQCSAHYQLNENNLQQSLIQIQQICK
ncbi:fimbrial biogenesis usher protein [Erwiniaceae bacterium BAC15a-03b]|uniref:Fimbrial biogenesis usher protein n=1 Tax=Winslowiella arboricola TaxID=2978220 RepID=A0A9J6PY37_9GAMM|nr:fimbrial biogenesis usher protein [Winslowiella arboricola]MCU5774372.1 fimbrial biogenesis usher protein [Winslowiella arboricola]MCU5778919.1 fimbrial biogenesis usher protein [Winslowiella arboricola]